MYMLHVCVYTCSNILLELKILICEDISFNYNNVDV